MLRADFADPNQAFVDQFLQRFATPPPATILDLGCGPADISARLATALPAAHVDALDGSAAMLDCARDVLAGYPDASHRVNLVLSMVPVVPSVLPHTHYHAIVSNSLLHHLHVPAVLWQSIADLGEPGTAVLVMDLYRPASKADAAAIVEQYAANEAAVLKEDFYNSLLAAFTPAEVADQLTRRGADACGGNHQRPASAGVGAPELGVAQAASQADERRLRPRDDVSRDLFQVAAIAALGFEAFAELRCSESLQRVRHDAAGNIKRRRGRRRLMRGCPPPCRAWQRNVCVPARPAARPRRPFPSPARAPACPTSTRCCCPTAQ